jgi:hypothetical protein
MMHFPEWHELFPDADYEFVLRLRRGRPADFFGRSTAAVPLLRERCRWLDKCPEHHLVLADAAEPALVETAALVSQWNIPMPDAFPAAASAGDPGKTLSILGRSLEPDLVLLRRLDGVLRLVAGCVCFPSSWSLPEKTMRSVHEIHSIVPALNEAIGTSIDRFLARLAPNVAWLRANWGLSCSGELNQHPWRRLPRLEAGLDPGRVFIRIEQQALVRLPETDGVLFGIRIVTMPLSEFAQDPALGSGLARALATMPEKVALYKGIQPVRAEVCAWLRNGSDAVPGF